MDPALRERTLARFESHRKAWSEDEALRTLYTRWYRRVREELPPPALGPWVELGSGPGLAREVIPELELSDVVRAPWHQHELDAESLPFEDGSLGALVLFDVLHHLPHPERFFTGAVSVLAPGGRIVICEPYVSPLSYPVYRFIHEEGCDLSVDPFAASEASGDDPFEGNQAIPTVLLRRRRAELERRFPELVLREFEAFAGLAYPASGGFGRRRLLPLRLWRLLLAIEDRLPRALFRFVGFRLLAVMERR
jgi:SAM-dependent methyltransferase